ncbi:MAG: PKD domain-containing protein [Methanospirillum sp.]|uniref:PKD domain-containing protein n=1 Tax=Methanospirillum sp. TaxID=45200 RepID=UPI002369B686|nr:PKD domain-containing protein [Methanospirillum sp.]MDD1729417.1 PKD domain-containing protein [Methanospirillum sp.]
MKAEDSIVDILSVYFLIAVVVGAMSITGVYLTQMVLPHKVPVMNFEACSKGGTISLYHTGGDTLNPKEINSDFYVNLLDKDHKIIKTIKLMPWNDENWGAGEIRNILTELHPTLDPSVKYVQVISKPPEGGENLIDWTQAESCPAYGMIPGPGCLARPLAEFKISVPDNEQPLKIQFTDKSQTDDPSYPITEREWDFGDGTHTSEQNPIHTYATAGSYTIRLKVANTCGSDEFSHLIQVGGCSSIVTAAMKSDPDPPISTTGNPFTISFTDENSSSSGSTIAQYEWDFGDGTTATGPGPHTRTYAYGTYYVQLVVTDECGNWATASKQVSVTSETDCSVSPHISAVPSSGKTPLQVSLYDNSSTSRGWINSWLWTFEDGTTSTQQGPFTREYTNPGPGDKTYTISLKVGNTCGATGNTTETITVLPPGHIIDATTDIGGIISPGGRVSIPHGEDQTFTITANDCYQNTDIRVDNTSIGPHGSYTFSAVDRDHTIHANFSRFSYTITPGASSGGRITPSSPVLVPCGENQSFTSTADACYAISHINIDGVLTGSQSSPNVTTFQNIHKDSNIYVTFEQITPTIAASAGSGGTINPSGNIPVNCGNNQSFNITANACYNISDIIIDGISTGAKVGPNTTTFQNVTTNHTIQARFQYISYLINATADVGGTISPSGIITVPCGGNQNVIVTANPCYRIKNVVIDGTSLGSQASPYTYLFANVQASHNISASFEHLGPYSINASAYYIMPGFIYGPAPAGSIFPTPACSNPCSVPCGNSLSYTMVQSFMVDKVTYDLAAIFIDGESSGIVNPYTFTNVQQNHTIVAYYAPNCYFVSGSVTNTTTGLPINHVKIELYDRQRTKLLWYAYSQSDGRYIIPVMLFNGDKYDMNIGNNTPVWKTMQSHLYYVGQDVGWVTDTWRDDIVMNPGGKCKTFLDWIGTR